MATIVPLSDAKASDANRTHEDKEKQLSLATPSDGPVVAAAPAAPAPAPALPSELEWSQLEPADLNLKLLHASLARLHGLADPQVEAAKPDTPWLQQLLRTMKEPDSKLTLRDFLSAVFDHYADRPFLATRADERSPYKAISYRDVWMRVKRIAAGMQATGVLHQAAEEQEDDSSGLAPPDPRMVTIGIYGFPSSDWVCVYLACLWLGVCAVPLQTNMSREALTHVLRHSRVRLVAAHADMLHQLAPAVEQALSVRTIVTMDMGASLANSAHKVAAIAHLRNLTLHELVQLGEDARQFKAANAAEAEAEAESIPSTPSPVSVIIFTSGSTGKPKGAVFPEPLWRFMSALRHRPDVTAVITTLFNMSHISGLLGLHAALNAGGTLHFLLRHDMSSFFDDCRLVRPTTCFLVPRLVELVHDHYLSECHRLASQQGKDHADPAVQQEVMLAMRYTFLGDRLALVVTGSAVTQPSTLAWFRRCFRVPLFNHFGATESLNISDDSRVDRGNILEYKLLSVPGLGYCTSDRPFPRGELCVKARDLVPEYYRDEEATAALRDEEGFLHTGDIVAEVAPDRIVYVDRCKNTLKLSQGEFVALAQLEATFQAGGPCVRQMFLYGRSDRAYLLAAVVPNMEQVRARLGDGADSHASVKALLQGELQRIASAASLAGWEVPRDMIVEPEAWSKVNGMLTDSDKYARPALLAKYKPAFDAIYEEIERRIHRAQEEHRAGKDERSASERLLAAVTGVLGCEVQQESGMQLSFVRMGGDSLSASRLSRLLKQSCGVSPPVAMLLDSSVTLGALVVWLEKTMSDRQQQRESWRPSFEQVHGDAAKVVRAADLNLERFFSADVIQQAARLPIASGPKHVLLTGANGFLGRFLLLELLQRGLRVTAIVRATSDEEAAKRLRASYGDLAGLLDSLSAQQGSLRVLAGDLMRGSLGLSSDEFASLCSSVDTVLHNGALVNHYLSYEQLWEPNVLGTVELMRFAMLGQRKPIVFLSSVAVAHGAAGAGSNGTVLEKQRGAQLWPERTITDTYAAGYSSSKWACEVLLEQLSQRCGVPTTIIRSSMVLAHPDLKGQVNKSDFVTRLFVSLVRTQCRPHSFYEEADEGGSSSSGSESRRRAHFDGVPVSVSSAGIVAALLPKSARESGACTTLHAVNAHHSDGVSLDSFADWVASAGYRLETLRPYSHWFVELSRRLSELPREVRDTTAYPIRHQWAQPIAPDAEPRLDNSAFSSVLASHTPFTAGVPVLDERFIHTYLSHMRAVGLIPEPAEQRL